MAKDPRLAELRETAEVTDRAIRAVVVAVLADRAVTAEVRAAEQDSQKSAQTYRFRPAATAWGR